MSNDVRLYLGDCLEVMKGLPDNSLDLIVTDPPYFKFKGEWWDRQWDTPQGFLIWIGNLCQEWQRVLKPNGSLYVFASPKMAARVEVKIGEWFNVLNHIVWQKEIDRGKHAASCKEILRGYFPNTERVIFAEHYGSDNIAKGEAGYVAKCDELRGFVFEPLRAYLAGERDQAGLTTRLVAREFQKKTGSRTITGMAGHWFERVQWSLPTNENYHWLRETFSRLNHGGSYLRRDYEDLRRDYEDLRRDYEDLRRDYEDLRRPFFVTADIPYTDVWDFPTVSYYSGKHPCEKPTGMIRHIVNVSSKPGGIVMDCFMGSGVTGDVCQKTGRKFIGIEIDPKYYAIAEKRIAEAQMQLRMPV